MNLAGKLKVSRARAIVTTPCSIGWRITSRTRRTEADRERLVFACVETQCVSAYRRTYSGGPEETWAIKGEEQEVQNISPKDAVIGFGDHKRPVEPVRANLDTDVGYQSRGLIPIVGLEQNAGPPNGNTELVCDCARNHADICPGIKEHAYIHGGPPGASYDGAGEWRGRIEALGLICWHRAARLLIGVPRASGMPRRPQG
jgi:hypothetical protein